MYEVIFMETLQNFCEECKYFEQHYVRAKGGYIPVGCGHCTFPRVKFRSPKNPLCANFLEKKKK